MSAIVSAPDGQQIAATQSSDLIDIAEGRSHDDRLVVKLLIVVVDARYTLHAGIIMQSKRLLVSVLYVPIVDATNKRRNEGHPGLGTCYSL